MPGRNQPRSRRGRSAIARTAMNTNSTNGLGINNGGGMKKGGAHPSATGFMRSKPWQISVPASRKNYAFKIKSSTYNNSDNNNDNNNNDNNQTHDHNVGPVSPQPPITCISCNFGTGEYSGCLISDDINKPTKYCCKKSSWGASGCEDGTVYSVCYDNTAEGIVPQCLSGGRFSNCGDTPPAQFIVPQNWTTACEQKLIQSFQPPKCPPVENSPTTTLSGEYRRFNSYSASCPHGVNGCCACSDKWGGDGSCDDGDNTYKNNDDYQYAKFYYDTATNKLNLCQPRDANGEVICAGMRINPQDMDELAQMVTLGGNYETNAVAVLNEVAERYIHNTVDTSTCTPYYYMNSGKLVNAVGSWKDCSAGDCLVRPGSQAGELDGKDITTTKGCGWWGRGVIQTTGPCNFGNLNYALAEAPNSMYEGKFNLCKTPELICNTKKYKSIKWFAGFFYWVTEVQGTFKNPTTGADWSFNESIRHDTFENFVDATSGLVNRGCPATKCAAGIVHGIEDRTTYATDVKKLLLNTQNTGNYNDIVTLVKNTDDTSFNNIVLNTLNGMPTVYDKGSFIEALAFMVESGINSKHFLTDEHDINVGINNVSAFLGQCKQETLKYGACDENNWSSPYSEECPAASCTESSTALCCPAHPEYPSVVTMANNMCACTKPLNTGETCEESDTRGQSSCTGNGSPGICRWKNGKCEQNIYGDGGINQDNQNVGNFQYYPNLSSCGQLGQLYQAYTCNKSEENQHGCDPSYMQNRSIVATTHAQYWGAAGPMYSTQNDTPKYWLGK